MGKGSGAQHGGRRAQASPSISGSLLETRASPDQAQEPTTQLGVFWAGKGSVIAGFFVLI